MTVKQVTTDEKQMQDDLAEAMKDVAICLMCEHEFTRRNQHECFCDFCDYELRTQSLNDEDLPF